MAEASAEKTYSWPRADKALNEPLPPWHRVRSSFCKAWSAILGPADAAPCRAMRGMMLSGVNYLLYFVAQARIREFACSGKASNLRGATGTDGVCDQSVSKTVRELGRVEM